MKSTHTAASIFRQPASFAVLLYLPCQLCAVMRSLFKGALLAAAERLESVYRRCVGQVTPVHKTARLQTYFKQKFKSLILFFFWEICWKKCSFVELRNSG